MQHAMSQAMMRDMQFTAARAQNFQCTAVLDGHQGCVNRLAWSDSGDAVLSGSDDRQVSLFESSHQGVGHDQQGRA
jgi:WD and tetratricopeptide repeats protein 1